MAIKYDTKEILNKLNKALKYVVDFESKVSEIEELEVQRDKIAPQLYEIKPLLELKPLQKSEYRKSWPKRIGLSFLFSFVFLEVFNYFIPIFNPLFILVLSTLIFILLVVFWPKIEKSFFTISDKRHNKKIEKENNEIKKQNDVIANENQISKAKNDEIIKTANTNFKKLDDQVNKGYSQLDSLREKILEICDSEWYPPDYLYSDAIEKFISYFNNHEAEDMGKAVSLYKEHLYREEQLEEARKRTEHQKRQADIAAQNAEEIRRHNLASEQEMTKQSKLQTANLIANGISAFAGVTSASRLGKIADNTGNIASSSAQTAKNSASAASAARDAARTASKINSKIPR